LRIHPQVPNAITIVRIACVPVFLWLLLADAAQLGPLRWWAAGIFIVAIGTDGIDGYLARKYQLVSSAGKLLDPIADKALTGAAFIGLSILTELPWWITALVLVRELGITVHRLIVASDHVVAAAWMGKVKTFAQAIALSIALLPLAPIFGEWIHTVNLIAMTIAVVLTVASGIDYVFTELRGAKRLRAEASR
jgi:CDP-diacylglycerol--glycerol-3-phosphate 3-phosphatidyltransferase